MSIVLSLTSCAIVAGVTLTQAAVTAVTAAVAAKENNEELEKGLETVFVDGEILENTLINFDCHFQKISDNEFVVNTSCGNLIYKRENVGDAYRLYVNEINDVDGLFENIKSFEVDYKRNVQAYTYDHIKNNLTDDMTIVEDELLDDDSLYLTINIE